MFMNSEEKSIIQLAMQRVLQPMLREELFVWILFVWMENEVSPQPGKCLIAATLWLPCDWQGRQIWLKEVEPLWTKDTVTSLASACFVQRTLKVLSKQLQSFAQLQYSPFPEVPHERVEGKPSGFRCGTSQEQPVMLANAWLKACSKIWALHCFWERRGLQPVLANCLALVSEQI